MFSPVGVHVRILEELPFFVLIRDIKLLVPLTS